MLHLPGPFFGHGINCDNVLGVISSGRHLCRGRAVASSEATRDIMCFPLNYISVTNVRFYVS